MQIINLTPHPVVVMDEMRNTLLTIAPSGIVARAAQTDKVIGAVEVDGVSVPLVKSAFGEVEGLPEPTEGTAYLVSIITLNAAVANGRTTEDLLLTSGAVRDDGGQILGCTRFARV